MKDHCNPEDEDGDEEDIVLAEFFQNDLENMAKYVYDEYKFDVPWPCLRRHFVPDVEWIFGGPVPSPIIPLCGRYEGHDAVATWLERMNKELTIKRWQPVSFITDKEKQKIVVVMDCSYVVNKTGKSVEVEEVHIHTVKDFVTTKLHILFDYTPVLAAYSKD